MTRLCLVSALTLTLALSAAGDWPRFRGPNGTGTADGPLPPIDPKAPVWKVPIPGRGAGSPIIVKGKILLQTASEDGTKRTLLCLDEKTGQTLWGRDLPGQSVPQKVGGIHAKNTLASSTPASDGERVYCVWWDGASVSLHAYDLDGNPKWNQPLGPYKSEHGAGHSPSVYGGKVFVNMDQDGAATLYAFDAATGNPAWTAPREGHRACYTTPMLIQPPGGPAELLVASTTSIDAYDPASGKVLWHFAVAWADPKKKLRTIGAPVYAGGLVICYFGEGGTGRYMIAVRPGSGDISATGKVWDANKQNPYVPSMLTKGDYLYWLHDDGRAVCAEVKTGKVVWEETIFGNAVTASPVLVGDQIVAISERGQIALLKASPEFEIPKKIDLGETVFASPAVSGGRLYVRGSAHLFCFGPKA